MPTYARLAVGRLGAASLLLPEKVGHLTKMLLIHSISLDVLLLYPMSCFYGYLVALL